MDQFLRRTVPAPPNVILTVINDGNGGLTVELGQDQPTNSFTDPSGARDYANNPIVFSDVNGTKEFNTCSDRGLCAYALGLCTCFPGYGSSDGAGNEGKLGECGYVEPYITAQAG